jgi:hypothetical protein
MPAVSLPAPPRRNLAGYLSGLARPLPRTVRSAAVRVPADVDLREALARVAASGHPPESASALAELWDGLSPLTRVQVARPLTAGSGGYLRLGSRRAVQTSSTTCGSAVLVALLAAGDPVVATWLVTGRRLGSLPAEIAAVAGAAADEPDADDAPLRRFAAAQGAMQRATSRRGLGLVSWPAAFGTPPWTAARHARYPGVRYSHRPVDDADRPAMQRLLAWLRSSLDRGIPVPLYTGGDLVRGVTSAVPRHVVLAVPPGPGAPTGVVSLYEPGSGRIHDLAPHELVARSAAHPALGDWTHVCWAVLPRAARGSDHARRGLR